HRIGQNQAICRIGLLWIEAAHREWKRIHPAAACREFPVNVLETWGGGLSSPSSRANGPDGIAAIDEVAALDRDRVQMTVGRCWRDEHVRHIMLKHDILAAGGIRQSAGFLAHGEHLPACASQGDITATPPNVYSVMSDLTRFPFTVTEISKTGDHACA